ncbi:MAG: hypothetical protein WCT49_01890 [Candidatus Paceibacterota bacterium]|jgi:hypothetical protein|nr:hypothetical protein [Candidatus Paceibacterota bacterium]
MNTYTKKIIFAAVLAAVGSVLYFFYFSPNNTAPTEDPKTAVLAFYNNYQNCVKDPPREAKEKVSEYCQSHTGVSTVDLEKNIAAAGIAKLGADPIVCAQNLPESILMGDVKAVDERSSIVTVKESFGDQSLDVRAYVKKTADGWFVDNVVCPAPDPASDPEIIKNWAIYTNDEKGVSFKYPASAGSNFPPEIRTMPTGIEVSFRSIGTEFTFMIQPIRPGIPKYFKGSIFQESDEVGSVRWDISLSMDPPFVAYQTTKNGTRYTFVFTNRTEKDAVQESILKSVNFLAAAKASQKETVMVSIGEKKTASDVSIAPRELLEDSRCPANVQCIQAGTVRMKALMISGLGTALQEFALGKMITTEAEEVTLIEVLPAAVAGVKIEPSAYQFVFTVKKR